MKKIFAFKAAESIINYLDKQYDPKAKHLTICQIVYDEILTNALYKATNKNGLKLIMKLKVMDTEEKEVPEGVELIINKQLKAPYDYRGMNAIIMMSLSEDLASKIILNAAGNNVAHLITSNSINKQRPYTLNNKETILNKEIYFYKFELK